MQKIDSFKDSEEFLERIVIPKAELNRQLFDLIIELVLEFQAQKDFYRLAEERSKPARKTNTGGKATREVADIPKYSIDKAIPDARWKREDSSFMHMNTV